MRDRRNGRGATWLMFPRTKRFLCRCTVITAIWRAYKTLASGNPKIRRIQRRFRDEREGKGRRGTRFHFECTLKRVYPRDIIRERVV